MMPCTNKLSQFPSFSGCANHDITFPILYEDGGIFYNYNLTFADLVCGIPLSGGTSIETFELSGNTLFLTQSNGVNFAVDLSTIITSGASSYYEFTGNTSATCINDLYVHNLGGCSPINLLTDLIPSKIDAELSVLNDFNLTDGYNPRIMIQINNQFYGVAENGGGLTFGTLWKYDIGTSEKSVLFEFDNKIYGGNAGSLLECNNNLYGICQNGGSLNYGTLWEYDIVTSGMSVLFNFDDTIYGSAAFSLSEYNNNIYGVCQKGGTYNVGTLWEYDIVTSGMSVLFNFDYKPDGGYPTWLMELGDKIYCVCQKGGTYDGGTLWEYDIVTSGMSVLHHFNPALEPSTPISVIKYNNSLYGGCFKGGAYGNGSLWEYNTTISEIKQLHYFNALIDGTLTTILVDYNDALYGLCYYGGQKGLRGGVLYRYDFETGLPITLGSAAQQITTAYIKNTQTESITISPTTTPTSSGDTYGDIGNIVWDDSHIYVKTNLGWGRHMLEYDW